VKTAIPVVAEMVVLSIPAPWMVTDGFVIEIVVVCGYDPDGTNTTPPVAGSASIAAWIVA